MESMKSLILEAQNESTVDGKLEAAQKALKTMGFDIANGDMASVEVTENGCIIFTFYPEEGE